MARKWGFISQNARSSLCTLTRQCFSFLQLIQKHGAQDEAAKRKHDPASYTSSKGVRVDYFDYAHASMLSVAGDSLPYLESGKCPEDFP